METKNQKILATKTSQTVKKLNTWLFCIALILGACNSPNIVEKTFGKDAERIKELMGEENYGTLITILKEGTDFTDGLTYSGSIKGVGMGVDLLIDGDKIYCLLWNDEYTFFTNDPMYTEKLPDVLVENGTINLQYAETIKGVYKELGATTSMNAQAKNEATTTGLWKTSKNNLITPTSIAGVEVIGKRLKDIKQLVNPALTWEDDGENCDYNCKAQIFGKTLLLEFKHNEGVIYSVEIFDTSLATAAGLRVGNTSGDILKKYPNASSFLIDVQTLTVYQGPNYSEYTKIDGIRYFYDFSIASAGQYAYEDNEDGERYYEESESKIHNKNAIIEKITIGNE